jgi:hypothetical protein
VTVADVSDGVVAVDVVGVEVVAGVVVAGDAAPDIVELMAIRVRLS